MKATPQPHVPFRRRLAAVLRRMSQAQLADQLGVSQPAVAQWKSGVTKPSGPTMILFEQLEQRLLGAERSGQAKA